MRVEGMAPIRPLRAGIGSTDEERPIEDGALMDLLWFSVELRL